MDKLLQYFLLVAFKFAEGFCEYLPINCVDGLVGPVIFVLEINAVLLRGMRIAQILCLITCNHFLVDM